ncbi:DUF29 domain-containing protein [Rhodovibrio sodomensis]|nr:DUF29 domain-containing protein [Rhodovibrio sodomensis]
MGDPLYDRDFYRWTQDQARRLRALEGDNRLDTGNLAEEVADLGRSELNKVASHLYQALAHLLLAAWSPADTPQGHWQAEIRTHLREARRAYTPGMRQHLDLAREWREARLLANDKLAAHGEPGLPEAVACPFTLDDLLGQPIDVEAAIGRVRAGVDQGLGPHHDRT